MGSRLRVAGVCALAAAVLGMQGLVLRGQQTQQSRLDALEQSMRGGSGAPTSAPPLCPAPVVIASPVIDALGEQLADRVVQRIKAAPNEAPRKVAQAVEEPPAPASAQQTEILGQAAKVVDQVLAEGTLSAHQVDELRRLRIEANRPEEYLLLRQKLMIALNKGQLHFEGPHLVLP